MLEQPQSMAPESASASGTATPAPVLMPGVNTSVSAAGKPVVAATNVIVSSPVAGSAVMLATYFELLALSVDGRGRGSESVHSVGL